jgi:hypothetical protein
MTVWNFLQYVLSRREEFRRLLILVIVLLIGALLAGEVYGPVINRLIQ